MMKEMGDWMRLLGRGKIAPVSSGPGFVHELGWSSDTVLVNLAGLDFAYTQASRKVVVGGDDVLGDWGSEEMDGEYRRRMGGRHFESLAVMAG